ncbi:efflux RND transporter permease subunit [Paenibacillus radicis (ex Xue et al. 2023)]|uniref:Efflux RND transporter permease subunit n=1 Tax=Paenibacillus radicis (ex Xue et al. 2023) TaxID=2972489 RepID=A0ABT1YND9_9BACL|nr:efflux RND transporter permease subunit [Paenibacillus radicis (ex Xue et al. 2023)]MCR8634691.1 efflux RND transporter permease subunit [Paenibacillus radicis (ex Xue et al. 2023)]
MIAKLLKYRKVTLLFFCMAMLLGIVNVLTLKQRENPEIDVTVALVKTIYPGASPEKVEQLVTRPLEKKIKEMSDISIMSSTSMANVSVINVEIKPDTDIKRTWDTLRQKVQSAESELPAEAEKPVVNDDMSKIAEQILHFVVDKKEQLEPLRPMMEIWKTQLSAVPGVSDVDIIGLPEQEVAVILDTDKLDTFKLPWGIVAQSLMTKHDRVPLGTVEKGAKSFYVDMSGEWKTAEHIANTELLGLPAGSALKIRDVANVKLRPKESEVSIFHNGKPTLDLVINAKKGADIPALQHLIDVKASELRKQLPNEVQMESLFSQKESLDHLFKELGRELLIGIAAVILVCSMGLTFGTSWIVALAIPISITVGFIPVELMGIDLNQITVVAIVIVLGILVDDAIVVNDNIQRRLQLGDSPAVASLEGSRDVAISILTATIATAAAFLPLFFLKGNIGSFIRPLPVVISLTLAASMAMSLTIIPIFRQWAGERALRKKKPGLSASSEMRLHESDVQGASMTPGLLGKPIQRLSVFYGKQIHRFLKRPLLTGTAALLIGTSSFGLLPLLGVQYFPPAEKAEMLIDFKLPTGRTLAETEYTLQKAADWMQQQPGVVFVSSYSGRTTPRFYYSESDRTGTEIGQLFVKTDPKVIHTQKVISTWRQELKKLFPEDVEITPRELEQGPPVGAPIAIRISGGDLLQLRQLSHDVQDILKGIPGTISVSDDVGTDMNTFQLLPDPAKLQLYGVSEKDLSQTIRIATEGLTVTTMQKEEDLLDVTLYAKEHSADPQETMKKMYVPMQKGGTVSVRELGDIRSGQMIKSIHHRNQTRTIIVRSYTENRLPDDVVKEVKEQMSRYPIPVGYTVEYGGENEERNDAFAAIGKLSIIVVLLIYILMVMQFYCLSIPLLILSTVYLAAGGAVIGLYLTNSPIGFMALMGLVSLAGIVVRNGIILIEFIEQARKRGLALHEAVAEAGKARLRPILLTMATAIGGLLPMTIMGGNLWRPMGITIISGLIYSTLLTLIVVPSLFVILETWREKRAAKRGETAVHG